MFVVSVLYLLPNRIFKDLMMKLFIIKRNIFNCYKIMLIYHLFLTYSYIIISCL